MKKRLLPLALALGLSLALALPALAAAEAPQQTYEQAVAELRGQDGYQVETVYEADLCSVFSYSIGGTPHGSWAFLKLIYKAGAPLGEGTVVNLPLHESNGFWRKTYAPDVIELSEDGKSLTYSYYSTLTGTELYTVELSTAEITTSTIPPTYEEIFAAHTWGYTVERQLEASGYSVVLMWSDFVGLPETEHVRDYVLALISKKNMEPEKQFQRLVLPSTTAVGEPAGYPTDRAPDSLTLSEDGSVLTYVYSFEDALFNAGGELLHDVGTYTYTVDTATGELAVTHEKDTALPSPALGAEGTTFVDVSPEDWFAPYVDVCVEAGLMKGVGEGKFDPQGVVTMAEAATIAARLHHLQNGGDGNLPKAPEEWGRMTLTFEDGETCHFYSSVYDWDLESYRDGWQWGGRWSSTLLYFNRADGWDGRDYQRVSLTAWTSDIPLQGKAEVVNNVGTSLHFIPDDFDAMYDSLHWAPQTPPYEWYRDTDYYLVSQGLGFSCGDYYARRDELVSALDEVAGSGLEPINHITDYPDSDTAYYDEERERVLRFYNAGILTGTDQVGSFSPYGYLTRAEVAAMAARILKPELRVEFSLEEPTFQHYSLTPLNLDAEFDPLFDMELLSTELLRFYRHDQDGQWTGVSILRSDGTVIDLPEGSYLSQYPSLYNGQGYPLLVLGRDDMTMPGGWSCGVLDPLTGEMVVPFGPYAGHGGYPGAGNCTIVGDGRAILTKEATWDRETWIPTLLRDDKGQVVCELPEREGLDVYWWRLENGLAPAYDRATGLWGFVDVEGNWAIQPQYCNYDSFFVQDRAIVCREDEQGSWKYGVIDAQGREVIPCQHAALECRGNGLYRADRYSGKSYWLREDGTTFRNGYLNHDIHLCNGYFALYNRYLDENFQYATPAVFNWTGPINSEGSGFVGMDGKVYRIQFEK